MVVNRAREEPGSGAPGRHEFWAENKHLEGVRGSLLHPLETFTPGGQGRQRSILSLRTGLPPVCGGRKKKDDQLEDRWGTRACWSSLCPAVHCTKGRGSRLGSGQDRPGHSSGRAVLPPCPLPLPGPLEVSGLESKLWSLDRPHHHQRPGANGHPSFPRPASTLAPQRPGDTGGKAEFTKAFHILCATDPWKDREADWHLPDKTMELSHQLHSPQGKAETSLSVQTTHLPAQASAELGEISPHPALRIRRSTALTL